MKITKLERKNRKNVTDPELDDEVVAESIAVNAHMETTGELGLKLTVRVNGREMTVQMNLRDSLDFWADVDGFKSTVLKAAKEASPEISKLVDTLEQAKNVSGLSQDGLKNLVKDIIGKKPDHVEDFHGTAAQLQTYIEGMKKKHPGVEVRVGRVDKDGKVEMADSSELDEADCDNCPKKEECVTRVQEGMDKNDLGEHVGEAGFILDSNYNPKYDN